MKLSLCYIPDLNPILILTYDIIFKTIGLLKNCELIFHDIYLASIHDTLIVTSAQLTLVDVKPLGQLGSAAVAVDDRNVDLLEHVRPLATFFKNKNQYINDQIS